MEPCDQLLSNWTKTEKLDTLIDTRFARLEKAKRRFDKNNQISSPKIQRIPNFLRQNKKFATYCTPKIISFGPIHHDNQSLKQAEHYKLLWTSKFISKYGRKTRQHANGAGQILYKMIEDNIEELKNLFTEDAIGCYTDNDLAWMLFVDGCSLVYFMENIDEHKPEALNLKFDQQMYMWRDILLLENQLPRKLLEILCKEMGTDVDYLFINYYNMGEPKRCGIVVISFEISKSSHYSHILDFSRSRFLPPCEDYNNGDDQMETQSKGNENNQIEQDDDEHWYTYKSIRDLKTAGIQVMANKNIDKWNWSNISFTSNKWFSGELRLPVFLFNDVTPYFFWNLIAYEMCPDVSYSYECCSFFAFMDSLIDNADDVKELRLAGVFRNLLGSDEDLAKLFNELGDDLPTKMYCDNIKTNAVAYSEKYILIKQKIQKHYTNKWKTWLAQVCNTHFSTPWTVIAFLAALFALVLTSIQTWYSVRSN